MCVSVFCASLILVFVENIQCVGSCCSSVQGAVGELHDARAWGAGNYNSDDENDDDQVAAPALGQLNGPYGVVAMLSGGVWVVDGDNHR